ncbi:hypothetical protein M427DRAFT_52108 [Gonapodya prolifera JEL478]|uniref:Uncharacterized protein n=1 Tax=Gonapodya prolifera (strain JEL478) TaxID=1344416 RepID=A0A139AUU2_GONPJ|nr:hypothetical protein M427DRAFT_52108 [Gonapodya prolifera JEL478]|eukprot:KXS20501.1 hypothetical protein M427DRAFT_52108 [Gonapodya prolifera JEL478]
MATIPPTRQFSPQSPSAAALRLASVVHLLARWGIESAAATVKDFSISPAASRLNTALDKVVSSLYANKLDAHLSKRELHLLTGLELGTWCGGKRGSIERRWESLGFLLWYLRILPPPGTIPRPYQPITALHTRDSLFLSTGIQPQNSSSVARFLAKFPPNASTSSLAVDPDDLRSCLNLYEAWYWRSRAQRVLEVTARTSLSSSDDSTSASTSPSPRIPRALSNLSRHIPSAITSAADILSSSGTLLPSETAAVHETHPMHSHGLVRDFLPTGPGSVGHVPYSSLSPAQRAPFESIVQTRLAEAGWCAGLCKVDAEGDDEGFAFVNPVSAIWKAEEPISEGGQGVPAVNV